MSGSRTGMPAPVKGRYAEQMLNFAPQALAPVGGFNTTDAAMGKIKATMDTQSRLADLERKTIEDRADAMGAVQTTQAMQRSDSATARLQNVEASTKLREADSKMTAWGVVATSIDAVGGAYDSLRTMQDAMPDNWLGKAAGDIGDVIGKIRPVQEKAYRAKKSAEDFNAKSAKIQEEANEKVAENNKYWLDIFNGNIEFFQQHMPSTFSKRSDEIVNGSILFNELAEDLTGGPQ